MISAELNEYSCKISKELGLRGGYCIGLVKDGQVEDILCAGFCDEEQKSDVNKRTSFPFSCNTKMLTALLAYDLADIDFPVSSLCKIKFSNNYITKNITLRDLLCHRSGICPNTLWTYLILEQDVEDTIGVLPLLKTESFRSKYIYSNYTYSIVGYILEKLCKIKFKDLLNAELADKIGIGKFNFYEKDNELNKSNILAKPFFKNKREYDEGELLNVYALNPASGLIVTIEEALGIMIYMLELCRNGKYKRFFSPNIISNDMKYYKETGYEKYALGLYHKEVYGYEAYYHLGYIVGYSSFVGFVPEINCGIVVLCNNEKTVFPRIIAYKALEMYCEIKETNWKSRLLKEQMWGEYGRRTFENKIVNLADKRSTKKYKIHISKYGLVGEIDLEKMLIQINNHSYHLLPIHEKQYYTYIKELNDYLILSLDERLSMFGTNMIDRLIF